tara:strand:- start:495 stop:749 length:255 start_codon:yes stop_codon:yes gene_type:complete
MGKKEKYGNYMTAVGYLSVRAKIILPKVGRNTKGEKMHQKGSCEYFVYHTNTKMAGPFKSYKDAFTTAEEMIGRHHTKKDLKKL